MRRLGLLFVVAAAATSLSLILARDAHPSFSGTNGRILFASGMSGNLEVYSINADGTGQANLTNNSADDRTAKWSPDGRRIVFSSNRTGFFEIYSMNADGSGVTQLTDSPSRNVRPSFTADGIHIIFQSNRDGSAEIYRMNADGSNQTNLTNDPGFDGFPAAAPHGQRIVFSSDRSGVTRLYTMNDNGRALQQVLGGPVEELDANWSPQGNNLVFEGDNDPTGTDANIYVSHTDGSALVQLTDTPNRAEFDPAWSPDGSRIVFQGCNPNFINGAGGYCQLYTINPDGTGETPLSYPPPSIPATDDFNSNTLNTALWTGNDPTTGSGVSRAIVNQRLEMTTSPGAAPPPNDGCCFHAQLEGACLLHGDYDLQVDFATLDWPDRSGVNLDIVANANGNMGYFSGIGGGNLYGTFFNIPDDVFTPTSDTTGTIRLVRTGGTLSGYYLHTGVWVLLKSTPTSTIDTSYELLSGSDTFAYTNQFARIAFDNFRINSGQLDCPLDGNVPDWGVSPN